MKKKLTLNHSLLISSLFDFSYNSPEYCIAFHALAAAGLTITTCNPAYTVEETQHQLRDSGARAVFTVKEYLPKVKEICEALTPHCRHVWLMDQDATQADIAGQSCCSKVYFVLKVKLLLYGELRGSISCKG